MYNYSFTISAFVMTMSSNGRSLLPLSVATFCILSTTSIPYKTSPKTVYPPSR